MFVLPNKELHSKVRVHHAVASGALETHEFVTPVANVGLAGAEAAEDVAACPFNLGVVTVGAFHGEWSESERHYLLITTVIAVGGSRLPRHIPVAKVTCAKCPTGYRYPRPTPRHSADVTATVSYNVFTLGKGVTKGDGSGLSVSARILSRSTRLQTPTRGRIKGLMSRPTTHGE